jgi:hypothetical protein
LGRKPFRKRTVAHSEALRASIPDQGYALVAFRLATVVTLLAHTHPPNFSKSNFQMFL